MAASTIATGRARALERAIGEGFLVRRRRDDGLRDAYRRHCRDACLPVIEVRVKRRLAYFSYDNDPTDRWDCGAVRLSTDEAERVRVAVRETLTKRGALSTSNSYFGGGPCEPEKLLAAMPEVAAIARAAAKRFASAHPNAGAKAFCPHAAGAVEEGDER